MKRKFYVKPELHITELSAREDILLASGAVGGEEDLLAIDLGDDAAWQ